jgi:hypothetical protein
MSDDRYPIETLDEDEDNGTMPDNVAELAKAVVGHRIASVVPAQGTDRYGKRGPGAIITLDTGKRVHLAATDDCCAYTQLDAFLLHPELVDHIITGVGTTGGYTTWHIFADMGDVLELTVDWSPGNQFYYGYGFSITVADDLPAGLGDTPT